MLKFYGSSKLTQSIKIFTLKVFSLKLQYFMCLKYSVITSLQLHVSDTGSVHKSFEQFSRYFCLNVTTVNRLVIIL